MVSPQHHPSGVKFEMVLLGPVWSRVATLGVTRVRGHSRWVTAACLSFPGVHGVVLSGTSGALLVSRKACGGWNPSGNPQSCGRRECQRGPMGVSGAVDEMWDGWGCP